MQYYLNTLLSWPFFFQLWNKFGHFSSRNLRNNLGNLFITIFFGKKISVTFGKMIFSKFWAPNMSQNRLGVFGNFFLGLLRDIPYQNLILLLVNKYISITVVSNYNNEIIEFINEIEVKEIEDNENVKKQ